MEYKKVKNHIIVRLDVGEEIISSIMNILKNEKISFATVSGIGATNDFTVGTYDVTNQFYKKSNYKGVFEIVSLLGNTSTMNNEPYIHIHMSAADKNNNVVGGHLNEAYISATAEIVLNIIETNVDRIKDSNTELNIFKFSI